MRIEPGLSIEELVRGCPAAVSILREFGIRCIRCGEPIWITIEEAAREKGIDDLGPVLHALEVCASERDQGRTDG